jgi:hypothetical protein
MAYDPDSVTIPRGLFETLQHDAACELAARFVDSYRSGSQNGVVHPGDDLGRVVAWVWRVDREATYDFLATYMAQIRVHGRDTIEDMPFSSILDGLVQYAWPGWASDDDAEELRRLAPERVQSYFGNTWLG